MEGHVCSDVPPLDTVESLTWIERRVSLSMGHGTCIWKGRGSREARSACARRATRSRPHEGARGAAVCTSNADKDLGSEVSALYRAL